MIAVSKLSTTKKWIMIMVLVFYGRTIMLVPYMKDVYYDQLIDALRITNTQLGMLASAVGIASIFGYFFGGFIADRVGSKTIMIVSCFSAGICTLWYATLPKSFIILLIIHAVMALIGTLLFWSAYVRMLRLLGGEGGQGTYYGLAEGIRGLVGIICPIIVSAMMSRAVNAAGSLRAGLLFYAATYFISGILSIFFIYNIEDDHAEENRAKFDSKDYARLFKNPGLWAVSLLIFGTYMVYCLQNYTTPYLTGVCNVSAGTVATIASVRQYGIGVLAMPIFGIIADKVIKSPAKASLIGAVLLVPASIGMMVSTANRLVIVIFLTIVIGFLANGIRGVYYATQNEAGIPLGLAGAAAGIMCALGFTPDAFVFTQVGAWLDKYPAEQAYRMIWIYMLISACLAIAAAIWILVLSRKINQSESKEVA